MSQMRNQRLRSAQIKVGFRESNPNDFISRMPDDILLMILSLLPIKDTVVTSSLSTRWMFLWCNLDKLNFDGTHILSKRWRSLDRFKYIDHVNNVIKSYNLPAVQDFRICFNLDYYSKKHINQWLKFAVNKKVELLELDLTDNHHKYHYNYLSHDYKRDVPLTQRFKWPSWNAKVISLRKLILKNVNMREAVLQEFLNNSPHLETISIHKSGYLKYVHVSGRALKLKHLEIVDCSPVKSVLLSDFDLVLFIYKGPSMDFRFADLPKLKEVDIDKGLVGFENNVFRQISSCASSLQTLSFTIPRPKKDFKLDFFPELPNVKTLTITIGARRDECLLEYASVANACPRLETFTVKLLWLSPIRSGREVRHFSTETHEHLKVFQILGYYGRISDFDLAAYVIENAVALKKVVIDPRHQDRELISEPAARGFSTCEQATRSCAKHQLLLILPPGVELVML